MHCCCNSFGTMSRTSYILVCMLGIFPCPCLYRKQYLLASSTSQTHCDVNDYSLAGFVADLEEPEMKEKFSNFLFKLFFC